MLCCSLESNSSDAVRQSNLEKILAAFVDSGAFYLHACRLKKIVKVITSVRILLIRMKTCIWHPVSIRKRIAALPAIQVCQACSGTMQVKQITADITPILNTFSQGILQNPNAASVLNGLTSGPEVSVFVNQVQSLAAMLSPNIQGLLVKRLHSM